MFVGCRMQIMSGRSSKPGSTIAHAERPPAFPAGTPTRKAAPEGAAEAAVVAPARARNSAISRLSLRLRTTAALHSAMLQRSVLKGLSLAEVVRASHRVHTELSAKRSVVGFPCLFGQRVARDLCRCSLHARFDSMPNHFLLTWSRF